MRQMQSESSQLFTYQTRILVDDKASAILDDCAGLLSSIERKLFADFASGKKIADLKSQYIKKYQITARHFNAIRMQLEGKIASIKERQSSQLEDVREKIKNVKKTIEKWGKKPAKENQLHQKKRYLFNLQNKEQRLESDVEMGKVRLCFGSKKLFCAQFNLEANGYKTHAEWFKDWCEERNNSFFLVGSKDETNGNQLCTATIAPNETLNLRIRLPNDLAKIHGKYLLLEGVYFEYGHDVILESIKLFEQRKQLQKQEDPNFKQLGLPISYRFLKNKKGWRVFVTTPKLATKSCTSSSRGVIGLDINSNHLALVETDRFGNPVGKTTIRLNTYGKNEKSDKGAYWRCMCKDYTRCQK